MKKTVRDHIKDIQNEIRTNDFDPNRASEMLSMLSSLLGNVNDQLKDIQMSYNRKLMAIMKTANSVSGAKLEAETTNEFEQLLDIKGTKELVLEMIRSMKYYLKAKMEEYKETRY